MTIAQLRKEEPMLADIAEMIGLETFLKYERSWRAKLRQDREALQIAVDTLKGRLAQVATRGAVRNPGGYLHTRFHKLVAERREANA